MVCALLALAPALFPTHLEHELENNTEISFQKLDTNDFPFEGRTRGGGTSVRAFSSYIFSIPAINIYIKASIRILPSHLHSSKYYFKSTG